MLGLRDFLVAIWWLSAAVLVVSVALAAVGDQHAIMSGAHAGKWRGIFHHKNVFGAFAALLLAFTMHGRNLLNAPRWAIYGVGIAALLSLAMASSSTAIAAFIVAATAGSLASVNVRGVYNRLVFYVVCGTLSVLGGLFLVSSIDAVTAILGRDVTLSGRTAFWAAAVPYVFSSPLGFGYGTTGGPELLYTLQRSTGLLNVRSPHSSYIQVALDLGPIAATFIVIWLLTQYIQRSDQLKPVLPLIVSVITFHLFAGLTEVGVLFYPSLSLLMVVALTFHAKECRKQQLQDVRLSGVVASRA